MSNTAIRNILRISRCKVIYNDRKIQIADLNEAQHLYIVYACNHPGDTQDHYVKDLCLDKTTVAHTLHYLEKEGYIVRRASETDKRCKCVYPTDKAKEVFPIIRASHDQFSKEVMEGLSKEERQELERLTKIVCRNAKDLLERSEG